MGDDLVVHHLRQLGDVGVLVGLADVLVKEPGAAFPHPVHPIDLVAHLDPIEFVNHAGPIHDLGAAFAHHLVAFVQHRDLRCLQQPHLQGQVQGVATDQTALASRIVGLVHEAKQHCLIVTLPFGGIAPLMGFLGGDGVVEKVVQVDRTLVAAQESQVQDVVHGATLEVLLAPDQSRVGPHIRRLALGKVHEHLFDDVTTFDDVLSFGLVMGLREGDHVHDVRLHKHLPVGCHSQMPLGHIQVGREAGEATTSLLDDVEIEVPGERLD